jgi:hypothetical protein
VKQQQPVSRRRSRHRNSSPLIERLEHRQLLHAVVDFQLPGGGKEANITGVGQVINLDIVVTITGHDADLSNDGLQTVHLSLLSTNIVGGAVQGTLSSQFTAPFNGAASQNGVQADLDGDGDLDIGSNVDGTSSAGYFLARAGTMQIDGATVNGSSKTWKVGTATFTVTGLSFGVQTNLVTRTRTQQAGYRFEEDGAFFTPTQGGGMVAGPGVVLKRSPGAASVQGRVFNDKNANGIFDGNDEGISGFRVFLDKDFDGVLDSNEISKPVSVAGTYTFSGVQSGVYRVRQVFRDGWRQTNPGTGYHEVVLGYDTALRTRSFANTDTILIKGKVWMDANKNRFIDNGESGLPGWMLFIDHNKNGVLDKGDDWTLSDANGNYRFDRLPGGNYHVFATQATRYQQTAPASVFHNITLSNGGTTSNKNFGFKRLKT